MDEVKQHEHHEHKDSAYCQSCCQYWGKLSKFWKTFISIVLVLIIFGAGVCVGVRAGHFRGRGFGNEKGQYGMMGYGAKGGRGSKWGSPYGQYGANPQMMGRAWNQYPANGAPQLGQNQLSGTITNIAGNQITITDNTGKGQVILSQPNTPIMSATGPINITTLKTGSSLTAVGTLNATTNQFEAQQINVNQ